MGLSVLSMNLMLQPDNSLSGTLLKLRTTDLHQSHGQHAAGAVTATRFEKTVVSGSWQSTAEVQFVVSADDCATAQEQAAPTWQFHGSFHAGLLDGKWSRIGIGGKHQQAVANQLTGTKQLPSSIPGQTTTSKSSRAGPEIAALIGGGKHKMSCTVV